MQQKVSHCLVALITPPALRIFDFADPEQVGSDDRVARLELQISSCNRLL
jgi:hypothetical protein